MATTHSNTPKRPPLRRPVPLPDTRDRMPFCCAKCPFAKCCVRVTMADGLRRCAIVRHLRPGAA